MPVQVPGCTSFASRVILSRNLLFALLLCASLLGAGRASAQATAASTALPPATQRTIEQLTSLNQLPAGDWKFHAGDVAHGEAPELDASSWQTVSAKSHAPMEAVWYRRWIEVPKTLNGYDLTGARIWFQFAAYANGPMPQIIYFNGRRVALGDDLEPIVLFDQAKPGDKVLIAVKLLATVDKKTFHGTSLKIDFAPGRPNPEDLRLEFLSTTMLIPSLSQNATQDLVTLQHAITTVDLSALDANE